MNVTTRAAVLAVAVVLAACSTAAPRPVVHAAPPPVKVLTAAQERQECAALALVNAGYDTYAAQVRTVAGQYWVSQAEAERMIARVVRDACPSLVSVIPPGAPAP